MTEPTAAPLPRTVLLAVQLPGQTEADVHTSLDELARLAGTLGLTVVGRVLQRRAKLDSAVVVGEGKLEELASWTGGTGVVPSGVKRTISKARAKWDEEAANDGAEEDDWQEEDPDLDQETPAAPPPRGDKRADVIVVDHELSPNQLRNLERATSAEVMDRAGVIVEIFHRHARSREARLQVEIARLKYLAPRLRETGVKERQGGGIGGKGAGESAVELDRRKIRDRIKVLKDELEAIEKEEDTRRARRTESFRVALVGYTNAGKSSLMRALTGSEVYVADRLFATLDTTVRALQPETVPRILVSDTVGFIKKLPHDLVASFRSTLDEALTASLLLHIVDASDPTFRDQHAVTRQVLDEIGAGQRERRLVLNKADRLSPEERAALEIEFPEAWFTSAKDPAEVARLRERIVGELAQGLEERDLLIDWAHSALIGEIRSRCTVLEEAWEDGGVRYKVRGTPADLGWIGQKLSKGGA